MGDYSFMALYERNYRISYSAKNIFFCFKCKRLLNIYEVELSKKISSKSSLMIDFYLCEDCIKPLMKFIKHKGNEKQLLLIK